MEDSFDRVGVSGLACWYRKSLTIEPVPQPFVSQDFTGTIVFTVERVVGWVVIFDDLAAARVFRS
jgi:hypothetical protein